MPIDPEAQLEITALDWVPDFARGHVRDLRPRWACEEAGLAYRQRLISVRDKPAWYYAEQPWGEVPYLRDGDVGVFESGAILLHLGERDARLLPRAGQARADAIAWTFAALNSVEPLVTEFVRVDLFARDEEWSRLRRPSLLEALGARFDRLAAALAGREWLAVDFSIADIAMATVLRDGQDTRLVEARPVLADYLARATARPAFARALADQLAAFMDTQPQGEPA